LAVDRKTARACGSSLGIGPQVRTNRVLQEAQYSFVHFTRLLEVVYGNTILSGDGYFLLYCKKIESKKIKK
jgi:hypothetical protein